MSDKIYDVPPDWKKRAFVDDAKYEEMYARSIKDPNGFWAEQAKRIDWIKPFTKVKNTSFDPHNVSIKWFEDGTLNVAYNCVDRHLAKRGDQIAIIWEGDDPQGRQEDHLQAAARRGLPLRQRAEGARRQEGRPRHHLPADDSREPRSPCSPARASAPSIRWCSAASRPNSLAGRIEDCKSECRDHRRRGPARRPQDSAQGQCRRRLRQGRPRQDPSSSCATPAAR